MPRKKFDVEARVSVKGDASKNVKKIESNFKKLTKSIKAARLAIVASLLAIVGAVKLLESAGERLGQKRALERTLEAQGIAADEYVGKLKGLANQQIATSDIILSANRALALGIAASDIPGLLEAATKASVSLGVTAAKAFQDITTGVGRASPLILDNLGIMIDQNNVFKDYAASIGVATNELTKQQRTAAVAAAAIAGAAKGAEDFALAQSRVTVALSQSRAKLKEWFEGTVESAAKSDALAGSIIGVTETFSNYAAAIRRTIRAMDALREKQEEQGKGWISLTTLIDIYTLNLSFAERAIQAYGAQARRIEQIQAELAANTAKVTARYEEQNVEMLKAIGFMETWADANEKAAARTKRIEAGILAEATALDKLREAIGQVTQAELQTELDDITTALEAARIETGGNTAAFLEMEAKVAPAIDHLKARIKGLADGTGDIGEALSDVSLIAGTTGNQFDDLSTSVKGTTDALAAQETQARGTAKALVLLTGVQESLALAEARTALAATQAARKRITGVGSQSSIISDFNLSPFGTGGRVTANPDGNLVPA